MTSLDNTEVGKERRLIGLFAEMRQAAAKTEPTTWGAAKHDIAYLRSRVAEDPKLAALIGRLFFPPPVQPTRKLMADHAHGKGEPAGL